MNREQSWAFKVFHLRNRCNRDDSLYAWNYMWYRIYSLQLQESRLRKDRDNAYRAIMRMDI